MLNIRIGLIPHSKIRRDQIRNIRGGVLPGYREEVIRGGTAAAVAGGVITQKAEERYATLLQNNPEIFRYASLKYIASYLGITDSSLSRIRKEMSRH